MNEPGIIILIILATFSVGGGIGMTIAHIVTSRQRIKHWREQERMWDIYNRKGKR